MLIKLGRGIAPLRGSASNNLSLAGKAGIQFDIDFTQAGSYPGTGNPVESLVNPSNYDFDMSVGISPPLFVGSGASAYMEIDNTTDGIGHNAQVVGRPAFMDEFHKANDGQEGWFGFAFRTPSAWTTPDCVLMGNENNTNLHGWKFYYDSVNKRCVFNIADSGSKSFLFDGTELQTATDYLIFVHISHTSGNTTATLYINGTVGFQDPAISKAISSTTNPFSPVMLMNDDSQTYVTVGSRFYWFGMGNTALSAADILSIEGVLAARHARSYINRVTNITGLKIAIPGGASWVGWSETEIYDSARADVSNSLVTGLAGTGKNITSWSQVSDGEFGTDSTYSSDPATIEDDVHSSSALMWSSSGTSGMIGWFDFNTSVDRITSIVIAHSVSYILPEPVVVEDRDGNAIPVLYKRFLPIINGVGRKEYIF